MNNKTTSLKCSYCLFRIISFGYGLWNLVTAQNLGLDFVGIG